MHAARISAAGTARHRIVRLLCAAVCAIACMAPFAMPATAYAAPNGVSIEFRELEKGRGKIAVELKDVEDIRTLELTFTVTPDVSNEDGTSPVAVSFEIDPTLSEEARVAQSHLLPGENGSTVVDVIISAGAKPIVDTGSLTVGTLALTSGQDNVNVKIDATRIDTVDSARDIKNASLEGAEPYDVVLNEKPSSDGGSESDQGTGTVNGGGTGGDQGGNHGNNTGDNRDDDSNTPNTKNDNKGNADKGLIPNTGDYTVYIIGGVALVGVIAVAAGVVSMKKRTR